MAILPSLHTVGGALPSTRRLLLIGALAVWLPAAAAEVPAADARAIQAVVRDQLAAFAADDAPRAFAHASAALQLQLGGSSDRFMAMVRSAYPPVYRPASVAFLRPEHTDGQWTQGVHLTDAEGRRWLAVYRMEREGAGRPWRIGGCVLVPATGPVARSPGAAPPA